MPDYSLVPVDHQPDFGDYSLVPVDYDPFAADGVTQQAQIQQAQAQPQQQRPTGAGQPNADAPAAGSDPSGSVGGSIGPAGRVPNPTLDQDAAKTAPFSGQANPTPTDSLPSHGGPIPLLEHGKVDSYFYARNSTGTPPEGPQVTTANRNLTIAATENAKPTNFGGVYGHTLTFSEPGSSNLRIITAADPTGLLVATPVEGNPNLLSVREYKGY
ncbi:hypothetical protein ACE10Z_40550 [Bradyrhizobium sp. Pha-3]|uniref:hypothetical protein n=1 Tax=Bradyrhizobium sp. Pha-3 TaxID=208375 RepID=UPI0035D47D86